MKDNLRRLNRVINMFGEGVFYTVTATEYNVNCQGKYDAYLVSRLTKLKFGCTVDANGYLILSRDNIRVALT